MKNPLMDLIRGVIMSNIKKEVLNHESWRAYETSGWTKITGE